MLRIGIDFDNTIVRYDEVFRRVAIEQGLIAPDFPANKGAIRDHLRALGMEDRWTAMQGYVYGERMIDAPPFPGVLGFLVWLRKLQVPVFIISHKTWYPYLGPKYDLHESAQAWLEKQGFFDPARIGIAPEHVFFELTKQAKLDRIAALQCSHFIDDLPELLCEPQFPAGVTRLLFDPGNHHADSPVFSRFHSWSHALHELLAA
jgi:hypothetical protein